MTPNLMNAEVICDLQGQPLQADAATLLKALDKLLTVGAYYSAEHDQYLQAARKARDSIVGVIKGSGGHVAIEITAQGLMVGHQNIDPTHRNVRLLHDLLVPLNIARLEIDGTLSPEDLRQALTALQEHKMTLGQSSSFQEIVIQNLPPSVRTVGCSVAHQSESERTGQGQDLSLDDLLGRWDEDGAAAGGNESGGHSEQLARQFMDMVSQILENMEQLDREGGVRPQVIGGGSYVTKQDLTILKQALYRLVEVNPDPAELTQLISQAQRALGLSRDPNSVDLVFQILKKDLAKEQATKDRMVPRKSPIMAFKHTVDELVNAFAELEPETVPVDCPWESSKINQLGIGLHLLRSDPPRSLRSSLVDLVERAVVEPGLGDHNVKLCAEVAATISCEDGVAGVDDLLPLITGLLRRKRPDSLALFWLQLVEIAGEDHLPELWPHLVNDILLGFDGASREAVLKLVLTAGKMSLVAATAQGRRLEQQPALQGKSAARQLFAAPLPDLYTVHVMLMTSPLKEWLGQELFNTLSTRPLNPLVEVLMAAMGEHRPDRIHLYLGLIKHANDDALTAELRALSVGVLQEGLNNLTPNEYQSSWVARGLSEFWTLDPELARPLLERVVGERKFFFFKAWPAAAREVADQALTAANQEAN